MKRQQKADLFRWSVSLCSVWLCCSFIVSASPASVPRPLSEDPSVPILTNVLVVFRHGDRTPIDFYPNDPYKDPKYWPVGFGQLTPTGKMMQFKLGQFLRKKYSDFLSDIYSEKDIYVRSTDIDRTLMSAYCNLAGLYPPKGNQMWNSNITWQPIPVHTVPDMEDNLLSSHSKCPRMDYLIEQLKNEPEIKAINEKYDWLYKKLSENTGAEIKSLIQVDYIFDTLYIEQKYNLTLPDWSKEIYPQPMKYLQDMSFKLSTWTTEMKRLRAGPLLQAIIDDFAPAFNESLIKPKFTMYSGHDTTIASLLNALDLFDPPSAPPYASMVIVEQFKRPTDGKNFVQISYKNDSDSETVHLQKLKGCDVLCAMEDFERITQPVRPKNWSIECQVNSDPTVQFITMFSITVTVFLAIVLVISVIVSFGLTCRKQGRTDQRLNKYHSLNQDLQ